MKKVVLFFTFLICFLSYGQNVVLASPSDSVSIDEDEQKQKHYEYERIVSFRSEISIAENAEVTVTETIKVYANGYEIKRGIFRALPTVRNTKNGKVDISYKVISVDRNGFREPFHTEKEKKIFTVYIGDKDHLLEPGFYTYRIVYKTQDQIGKFKGFDEFYWNVNGTDWSLPVDRIQAIVKLPKGADILQSSCYAGAHGSTDKNCAGEKLSSTEMVFNAINLKQHENLTVAVGFKPNILKEPSGFIKWIHKNRPSLSIIFVGFYLLYFYYTNWKNYGKDHEKPIVVPQYAAPEGLSPGALGYIDKGEFSLNQVTANLIDLAIKGFVEIVEVKDKDSLSGFSNNFSIKILDKDTDELQEDQSVLLKKMFAGTKKVPIAGNYSPRLSRAIEESKKTIAKRNRKFVESNRNTSLIYKALKIILIAFFLLLTIDALVINKYNALVMAIPLILFNGLLTTLLVALWNDKSYKIFGGILLFNSLLAIPLFAIAFARVDEITSFESNCYKFLIFGVLSLLPFRYLINKPSLESVNMKAEIDGFKMYLGTAEENLFKFHNPPEMTTDVYERFLPYAIVFGVDGIWGKKMRNKLKETLEAGNIEMINNQFNTSFASSFSVSLNATTEEPYRSLKSSSSSSSSSSYSRSSSSSRSSYSGGSSSSGSSGSGSSGGGGGGGGGGGW